MNKSDFKERFSAFRPLAADKLNISFEFFPPNTPEMEDTLWQSIQRLAPLNPSFVSVTYGAGGSTRERTHRTVHRILTETDLKPASHLTCVGASKDEVNEVIDNYAEEGVNHLVALRGDAPEGADKYEPHPQGYKNAADLVAGIKARQPNMDISVACYPETHPDSNGWDVELDNLKAKVEAGASRAITQFFFDTHLYAEFVERARAHGIAVPIVPGVMPVQNYKQVSRFATQAGASVPKWLGDLYEGLDDDIGTRKLVAATVAADQVRDLAAMGVTDFHFYTLNRADLVYAICHILGLRPTGGAA